MLYIALITVLFTGVDFKNMPPCKGVLFKKIQRVVYLANMIKCSNENRIGRTEGGWILNECNEFEIDFFDGSPFPDLITNISIDNPKDNDDDEDNEDDEDEYFDSSDESEDET